MRRQARGGDDGEGARQGEANAAILQVSVTAVFNGLIGELRHLADDPAARLEKTPDQYERDFATQLGNLRQRTLERIQSNLFLVGDFRDSLRRIESQCNAAAAGGLYLPAVQASGF